MKAAFGATRGRGVRACGARGKTTVFGLFGRNGRVYAEIVPEFVQDPHSRRIIRGRVELESVIHSDDRRGHDGLVDSGCRKHFRGRTRRQRVCRQTLLRQRARKLLDLRQNAACTFPWHPQAYFYFYLKEYEFRFNPPGEYLSDAPQNAQGATSQLEGISTIKKIKI